MFFSMWANEKRVGDVCWRSRGKPMLRAAHIADALFL